MINFYVGAMMETAKIIAELEDESDSEASSVPLTRSAALDRDREGMFLFFLFKCFIFFVKIVYFFFVKMFYFFC